MNKHIIRSIFVILVMVVVITFITATSYTQLAIATMFYPPLVYFAYKLFYGPKVADFPQPQPVIPMPTISEREGIDIVDINKRAFLKLIGGAGLSFLLYSLFAKKTESLLFGGASSPSQDVSNAGIKAEGDLLSDYRITNLDEGILSFYGFTNPKGAWFVIREDPDTGSFRYSRGKSNFEDSWDKRDTLTYDYYYNVFP